jgi:UDP-GlcNAc:undecaprenyl-phosphate GlcNAc-1-phosphate transferase
MALVIAFLASIIFTGIIQWLAKKLRIVDKPNSERKIHKKPVPLLGGLAIFLSFNLVVLFYALITNDLTGDTIYLKNILGISLGTLILMVGGVLDDKYNLKSYLQIIWPILAIIAVIVMGVGIDSVTNPVGDGVLSLDTHVFKLFWHNGILYKITLLADVFTFFWLLGMIYTTKLLDGLDGLVSGVTIIAAIFMFFVALNRGDIIQYDIALLAMILVGVFAGFLVFNWNPASIFLGEGGSTMAGFLLGSISIISGSKVGVTLMLLSIPVLDFLWTIIRRLMEKRSPFASADKKHLHHRLLDAGFPVKKAVAFLYLISIAFGLLAYYFQDLGWNVLGTILLVMVVFMLILAYLYKRQKEHAKLDLN